MKRIWLKNLRLSAGLSQTDLAALSEITRQYYSHIETGKRRPSPIVAKRIAKILDFEWYKLLDQ